RSTPGRPMETRYRLEWLQEHRTPQPRPDSWPAMGRSRTYTAGGLSAPKSATGAPVALAVYPVACLRNASLPSPRRRDNFEQADDFQPKGLPPCGRCKVPRSPAWRRPKAARQKDQVEASFPPPNACASNAPALIATAANNARSELPRPTERARRRIQNRFPPRERDHREGSLHLRWSHKQQHRNPRAK